MSDGRGKHLYTNHRGLAMSTLKTTYIQHPSAVSPAIELTAEGTVTLPLSGIGSLVDVNEGSGPEDGNVLIYDAATTSWVPGESASGEVVIGRELFTASVTGYDWYAAYPAATRIVAEAVGGGGGGGGSSATANRGGGGGGAAAYIKLDVNLAHAAAAGVPLISQADSPGTQEEIWKEFDIVIGAGGTAGTGTGAGGTGGSSWVTFGRGYAVSGPPFNPTNSYQPARILAGRGNFGALNGATATNSNFSQDPSYSFDSGTPVAPSYWLGSYPVPLFDMKRGAAGGPPSNSPCGGAGGFAWPFNGHGGRAFHYYSGTGGAPLVSNDAQTLHGGHGGAGGSKLTTGTSFGGGAGARGSVQITFYGSA